MTHLKCVQNYLLSLPNTQMYMQTVVSAKTSSLSAKAKAKQVSYVFSRKF